MYAPVVDHIHRPLVVDGQINDCRAPPIIKCWNTAYVDNVEFNVEAGIFLNPLLVC